MYEPREARVAETRPCNTTLGAHNVFLGRLWVNWVGNRFGATARSKTPSSGRFEGGIPAPTLA